MAAGCAAVGRPRMRAAQKILVLYVDEALRAADCRHIGRVDAGVYYLACKGSSYLLFVSCVVRTDRKSKPCIQCANQPQQLLNNNVVAAVVQH